MKSQVLFLEESHRRWTPPAALDRLRPREVVLTLQGKVLVTIAILLIAGSVAAGVGLGIAASRDARNAHLLDAQGRVTDAAITRLWRGRDKERQPWIAYRFLANGRTIDSTGRVPLRTWRQLQEGESIQVRFLPSRPGLNYILSLGYRQTPVWAAVAASCAIAIASPIIFAVIRHQRRLLADGRVAAGFVTHHSDMRRGSHGEKLGMKFDYEFRLLSGATRKGSAGPMKAPPAVGSTIAVLYDAENPRRNMPYPIPSAMVRLARD